MRSIVIEAPKRIRAGEWTTPKPGYGEVLVSTRAAVAVQASRRGDIKSGEYMLVLGCGPIGLAIIEVVKAKGAQVAATDIREERLETAAFLGAEVLPAGATLLRSVLEQTKGEGAVVVVEATGNERVMEQSVELVACGGRIVIVGLVKEGSKVALPGLDFTRKEMTIVGSRASTRCFPEALELLASGAIKYPQIGTVVDFWEGPRVIREMDEEPGKYHKVVLQR